MGLLLQLCIEADLQNYLQIMWNLQMWVSNIHVNYEHILDFFLPELIIQPKIGTRIKFEI